jgi:hypothetical protein
MRRIDAPAWGAGRQLCNMTTSFNLRSASVLAAVLALLVSCKPNETKTLLEPSQALGAVLAEEAIHAAGSNKKIAIITHDDRWGPPSSVELVFKAAVERQGFSAFTVKSAYLGNTLGRGQVGLQADDFFEAVQKADGAGAIVSFAGAPLLGPDDAARLPSGHPPILVVATANLGDQPGVPAKPERLASLLEAKIIQAAIINGGSDSAAPSSGKTDATHELFARYYAILRQPQ